MKTQQMPNNFAAMLSKAHTLNDLNRDLPALMHEMARSFSDDPPRFLALALKQAGLISESECAHIEEHGFSFYPSESKVVKIEYWWDKLSRNWIIQAKDIDDNQIGAAEFAANSRTLPGALEAMRAQYPNVACVKS